jgi:flagellar biosynthesis regulator FlaF
MLSTNLVAKAYSTASTYRSKRDQEADIFRRAAASLVNARGAGSIQQVRALSDNRRLWMTVSDLMRDPSNALPQDLRAAILSVGITVQREMDDQSPDLDFLVAINENIAAGLAGQPD